MAILAKGKFDECFYCLEYNKLYSNYPVNEATNTQLKDYTPRCQFHWKYTCDKCTKEYHFNGISYCNSCNVFTCVHCGPTSLNFTSFFFYDYYYDISCHKCSTKSGTLDYLEFIFKHPIQLGKIKPNYPIQIWLPLEKKENKIQDYLKPWGLNRLIAISNNNNQIELDKSEITSAELWNAKADLWVEHYQEEGDFHHRTIILPNFYSLLELESYEKPTTVKVLDIGCGSGNVARTIARNGFKVTGIDYAENMLLYALKKQKKEPLGIVYINMDARNIIDRFEKETFDIIYANMSLMDMDGLETILHGIGSILKKGGQFTFSITHPIFSWPITHTLRLPKDSQRNEDKIWLYSQYYRTGPILVKMDTMAESWLYYPRPISTYLNECIKNNLQIMRVIEPKISEELIKKYPRQNYYDNDRKPDFLFVKTKKI